MSQSLVACLRLSRASPGSDYRVRLLESFGMTTNCLLCPFRARAFVGGHEPGASVASGSLCPGLICCGPCRVGRTNAVPPILAVCPCDTDLHSRSCSVGQRPTSIRLDISHFREDVMEALVKTNEPPRWYFGIARHTRHARTHLPGVSKTEAFIERPGRWP